MRLVYHKRWSSDKPLMLWFAGDHETNNLTEIEANLSPVTESTARRFACVAEKHNTGHMRMFAGFWVTYFSDKEQGANHG